MKALVERPAATEGMAAGKWVLLDYRDVVVHIFLPEQRGFYRLDRLWGDAEDVTPAP